MSEQYKLIYFNSKGRAEFCRYIFAFAAARYEDFRFELPDWERFIPFTQFNYVPVLEVRDDYWNKFQITGQLPISRFLAHRFKLCGGSEQNRAIADMIVHQVVNLFEGFAFINEYETDENKKREQYYDFIGERVPAYLELLENFLDERNTEFLVSNEVTWADLAFAAMFENFGELKTQVLYPYKRIAEIDRRINQLPPLVQWKRITDQSRVKFQF